MLEDLSQSYDGWRAIGDKNSEARWSAGCACRAGVLGEEQA
jgi:hypothetical protein